MRPDLRIGIAAIAFAACLAACTSPAASPGGAASSASASNACINPTHIRKQTIVSDTEIRFELNNGEVWVNQLPRTCPSLKFQQGFTWDVRGTLVCSNEQTIYVKDDGTPCQLGAFSKVSG